MIFHFHPAQERVLRACGVSVAYLFGSTVSGASDAESDVDVAVAADHALDVRERRTLRSALASASGKPAAIIDLIELRRATPLLAFLAVTEGVRIYGSEEADDDAFRRAVSAHLDAKPLYALDHAYVHAPA